MSPRRPDTSPIVSKDTPGPGAYNPANLYATLKQSGACKIGTSKRRNLHNSDLNVPGPNKYEVRNSYSVVFRSDPRPIFGSSERANLNKEKELPGPGQYQIPQKAIEGRQFSLIGRYKDKAP